MIIGVMSDTHGQIVRMQQAADRMIEAFDVEAILHLGDDYADALQLDARGRRVYAVPGMYEDAWNDPRIPHRLIKEFGGIVFMLSHTPGRDKHDRIGDINPGRARSGYGVDVLLHGHTHQYRAADAVDGLIVINPGHLKSDHDRGAPASFAIIEANRPDLGVRFYGVNGELLEERCYIVRRAVTESSEEEPPSEDSEYSQI